ncbi:flagellar protein FlaG [Aliagarivorans marinus]|uniref:flagellar protein FlaG n=1 Tax=Aliagarivorans marinus TaxID=561965 RepID=UPI00041B7970|nr:flagellar protein FlaG [Aliagarivorans marinus]
MENNVNSIVGAGNANGLLPSSSSPSTNTTQSAARENQAQNLLNNEQVSRQPRVSDQEQLKEVQQLREQQREQLQDDRESVQESVDSLNQILEAQNRDVKFVVDDRNGELFTSVFNRSTDELIREIPSEEFRELQQRLSNFQDAIGEATGLFVDQLV